MSDRGLKILGIFLGMFSAFVIVMIILSGRAPKFPIINHVFQVFSPDRQHVIVKNYTMGAHLNFDVRLFRLQGTDYIDQGSIYEGAYSGTGFWSDQVLVGWAGERDLYIGLPDHLSLRPNSVVDGITIHWEHYGILKWDSNSAAISKIEIERPQLTALDVKLSHQGRTCGLVMTGYDPTHSLQVTMSFDASGRGWSRTGPGMAYGKLKLLIERKLGSMMLTPQQFIIEGSPNIYTGFQTFGDAILEMNGETLSYSAIQPSQSSKIIHLLGKSDIRLRVSFTFGREVIEYIVHGMDVAKALSDFNACEKSTNLFPLVISNDMVAN